ncbi:glycosyl transferase family 1 [Anoxybacter fermentans]|uniref:Glycosyl transferase family 1 n=1 Tax=Anoxybacter fermentans TaxID=1323375 RepID=A0A3S9SYP4_9FIRM|nr:glycosyltransferase family 4 protein [Anoxybacter fermentans]AZR73378.1 glycosyl transferase family 1 [Anoxybacter fermentans]
MKIGLAHFRVGETDGVSLEMEKWRKVLEELGHQVYYISGNPDYGEIYIPELYYLHPENKKFVINGFDEIKDYANEEEFLKDILIFAERIEEKLKKAILEYGIELLIPNNIWSLGWGLPAGIAFTRVMEKLDLPCIAHHHDFYWERERYSKPTCSFVKEILNQYFPPKDPRVKHVVINKLAQMELKKRTLLESTVIPNVFDFDQPLWEVDDYNQDLRTSIGIKDSDLVILQATRVAERKAIELAIEVVGELVKRRSELEGPLYDGRNFTDESRIILVMAGLIEADKRYIDLLKQLAEEKGVEIKWINPVIEASRKVVGEKKFYSLWDAYAIADLITYPSILEGWGNQFLEGLFARKPMVIYEYPVYKSDIVEKGFITISLGDTYRRRENGLVQVSPEKISQAATESIRCLKDRKVRQKMVEENFLLGKKYYSYQVLGNLLKELLTNIK